MTTTAATKPAADIRKGDRIIRHNRVRVVLSAVRVSGGGVSIEYQNGALRNEFIAQRTTAIELAAA